MILIFCCFFQSLFSQPQKATAVEDTTFYDRVKPKLVRLVSTLETFYASSDEMLEDFITPKDHAIQIADMAARAMPEHTNLTISALLHEVGQMLYPESKDPAQESYNFLAPIWGEDVAHPVLNIIKAQRFLVAVDAGYAVRLSKASQKRLLEQGGAFSQDSPDYISFKKDPFFEESIALRIWDDSSKSPTGVTGTFADYRELLIEESYAHLRKRYSDRQIKDVISLIQNATNLLKSRL